MPAKKKPASAKTVASLNHAEATRKNIPSAEMQPVVDDALKSPVRVAYERRDPDLDPQFVWRGKSDAPLEVPAPPLYIQEKVKPKILIDDLLRRSKQNAEDSGNETPDLFGDFNGLPKDAKSTDFYQHDGHWSNRMILGDSLQVMASLAEREGLRGKVQCIYFDPPYGIKFNSNFQWSTTSRDVKDGNVSHITREPEQVKAFRDTWRNGIHSYLTYLRDRLVAAHDLITESGSIFVQIGDENVHRVRALLDEIFGEENYCGLIGYKKTTGAGSPAIGTDVLASVKDYIVWFAKNKKSVKYHQLYLYKEPGAGGAASYNRVQSPDGSEVSSLKADESYEHDYMSEGWHLVASDNLTSQTGVESTQIEVSFRGKRYRPAKGGWKTNAKGLERLTKASRTTEGGSALRYVRRLHDFPVSPISNDWGDTSTGSFTEEKVYVVQSGIKAVQRCILMASDPGDLIIDPTCGSGTTATVAEQWGRRWITIDTSRVALALARARVMGARYPFYVLSDSREGQQKESEVTRTAPRNLPTQDNIRHGFVYERVPHITLKSIANNAEIDVIWEEHELSLKEHRVILSEELGRERITALRKSNKGTSSSAPVLEEWELPREAPSGWPENLAMLLDKIWHKRVARQTEIDKSIAAKADSEYLYDRPYEDKKKVRVAGPFTVESVSPHRILHVDQNDEIIDTWNKVNEDPTEYSRHQDFTTIILENLKTAGVQQAHREDRITFTSIIPFPGKGYVCAEATYIEGTANNSPTRRAAIFIGPEFGTVSRPDLVEAAREAGDLNADVLIACAFNYDAHSSEFERLGKIPVLKARMNADLHMADDLKNTGKGNLFVIFGEPDITINPAGDGQVTVKINGVDVFKPNTGEVVSSGPEGIACWFIDTDYNEESFFVRHAYFLGQNDPYKALKTTLKAEIDEDAWATLNSDTSRPFPKPSTGRIAVKVINHLGDEVMKVFSV